MHRAFLVNGDRAGALANVVVMSPNCRTAYPRKPLCVNISALQW